MQEYLYNKCIQDENIIQAIKEINRQKSSFISGPDNITSKMNIDINICIKEVKLRLRRYKRINSKISNTVMQNGITQSIVILNLYDRYAHQAIYRIINPIIESKMSKYNYSKSNISIKLPISIIANIIKGSKNNTYIVKLNFEKYFNNISLDQALNNLKDLGINDKRLLITIKHLMWISKKYNGIGLSYGTLLGSLLYNCYFYKLDKFMENTFDLIKYSGSKMINYHKYKNNWIKWLNKRNKKIQCRYCRYLNEIIVLTTIKEEQLYIYDQILNFIQTTMQLNTNLIIRNLQQNKTNFLGFHLIKDKQSIWITIQNEQAIYNEMKKIKLINHYNIIQYKRFLLKIFNYYDVVNSMRKLLSKIEHYIFLQCKYNYIYRTDGKENKIFKSSKNDIIDIWQLRKETKISFKAYLMNSSWIKERELLIDFALNNNDWYIYRWTLFTKQKGKDKITNQYLKANDCVIHHIIPRKLGGQDELSNLILISTETHKKLHYSNDIELKQDPNAIFIILKRYIRNNKYRWQAV